MPDPYGITQVDVPGVWNAVQGARTNRIQQMMLERQVQAADRQAERDNTIRGLIARAYGSSAPDSKPGGAAATATPALPSLDAGTGAVPAVSHPPPEAAAPRQLDPQIAQQIVAADPEHGPALVHSLQEMDASQIEAATHRLQALGPLYAGAARIPYGTDGSARRAYIQSVAPQLQQLGIDPQQAMNWDPTDTNINAHMAFGTTMEQALSQARGHPMVAPQGSTVIDTDNIDPTTNRPRVIYESPTVTGPGGEPYARPPAMSQNLPRPRTPAEAAALPPGTQFIDPNGVVRTVPGGPTPPASGTFPQPGVR